MDFEPRTYRGQMNRQRFRFFNVVQKETDLWIGISNSSSHNELKAFCEERIFHYREQIESCIRQCPEFGKSFTPIPVNNNFPHIAAAMVNAAKRAGTGPMSAVAGAVAEALGNDILKMYNPEEVVIENGGDIFVNIKNDLLVQFFAGRNHNFSNLAINIPGKYGKLGICTSSGMFGHSFSFGLADSVTVVCKSTSLADAWATSICNRVRANTCIKNLTVKYQIIPEIISLMIIKDEKMGIAGEFELKMI
jgi:uncharacterized protein